jgi:hypothetical protein
MQESLEFATAVANTVSFVLVTPDLLGKERLGAVGNTIEKAAENMSEWAKVTVKSMKKGLPIWRAIILTASMVSGSLIALLLAALYWCWVTHQPFPPADLMKVRVASLPLYSVFILPILFMIPTCGLIFAKAILNVLKRYTFNGVLLAIGAAIFLTTRVLIMYDTWPHSSHAAAVVSHEQAAPGGQSGHPAEQP